MTAKTSALVTEIDGYLWKPKPGCDPSTIGEFRAARQLFIDVHEDSHWNPWVLDEQADELAAAMNMMDQWTRAEPAFKPSSIADIEAKLAADAEQRRLVNERADAARVARIPLYDPQRHDDRLRLLELDSIVRYERQELDELLNGEAFPLMPTGRRAEEVERIRTQLAAEETKLAVVRASVGDPEEVVDAAGRTPAERREISQFRFGIWRRREVPQVRDEITQLAEQYAAAAPKTPERSSIKIKLDFAKYRLEHLLAITEPTAADMCSECAQPASWHRWRVQGGLVEFGPCKAWPRHAAHIAKVREEFFSTPSSPVPEPQAPRPQPLASITSKRPPEEIMKWLDEVKQQWPDTEVQLRTTRTRLEIWPTT